MKFEDVPLDGAVGAILAHAHRLGRAMLKKGHVVTSEDIRALAAAGITRVAAARLEPGDVGEDEAARRVAEAITGAALTIARATTGRANIFAAGRGVLVVARERIDALNAIDEAITVATVPPYAVLEAGAMAATVKIIPFAVPEVLVARACDVAAGALLSLAPFSNKRAGLVLTEIAGVHEGQGDRAAETQRRRLAYLGAELARVTSVPHDVAAVAAALDAMAAEGLDLLLVLGASAIVDRKDVVPVAIEAIGGHVEHVGMPVDPGNMLLLGRKGATPIVGVPGCARSLKASGFDWVLERLVADLPVTSADITRLGVGGLLSEIASRPSPRQPTAQKPAHPRVAAIVLAAGLGRRMGGTNKLIQPIEGKPIIARVVDALLGSKASEVLVVVGHRADAVRVALEGRDVRFIENDTYEEGLGASIRAGVDALGDGADLDGALIALGDMPWVRADHVDAIIAAFDPEGPNTICVPVHDRKRGHPVLWSKRHFGEMKKLGGDVGARALLERYADVVLAVPVGDAGVHVDVDTPAMLADAEKAP